MGRPYSEDLRKRVVAADETGGLSCNEAAKQFGIAISAAIGWVRRLRETGSIAPGKMGGHKPKSISGEHASWVSQRFRNGDLNLPGLVGELAERGLKVDYRSVWEFVHAEQLSFKKSVGSWRTRPSRRGAAASAVDKNTKVAPILSAWSSSLAQPLPAEGKELALRSSKRRGERLWVGKALEHVPGDF